MKTNIAEFIAGLRSFPRAVWVLCLGMFLNRFGTFVMPFLALYVIRTGHGAAEAGLAIGCYGAGHLLASLLGGQMADTIGRRRTMLISLIASAVVMAVFPLAEGLPAMVVLAFVAGLVTELYRPACTALLADLVDNEHRVTAFGMLRLAINAGWALGPAAGGWLAAHSYNWLFIGDALTSLAFAVLAFFWLPKNVPGAATDRVPWLAAMTTIRRDRAFIQVLAATFLLAVIFMQPHSTFGLEVKAGGFSEKTYGLLLGLNGMLIVIFELPLTMITRRFPPKPTMALGYVMAGIGFGLIARGSELWIYVLSVTVFTFGEMICLPVQMAYVAALAPANLRGRYMGASGLTWAFALVVGPAAGMKLFEFDPNTLWFALVGCGVLAAAIIAWPARPLPVTAQVVVDASVQKQ